MKLYLAVAVLMLALVAYTEAQDEGINDKLTRFGDQMAEVGRNLVERTKDAFQSIGESEFAATSRDWFTEQIQKLRTKFQD